MSTDRSRPERIRRYFGFGGESESPVDEKLREMKRSKTLRRLYTGLGIIFVAIVFNASLEAVGFSLQELFVQVPQFVDALGEYFPPATYFGVIPFVDVMQYWEFIVAENLFAASQVTLSIAIAGTILGLPAALFFGVLASERVIPYPLNLLFRATMSLIRAIPALVWVLILIPLGGVTPFTATLAVMIDTTGYLGRLFTDELEEIATGPIEGIQSTGAHKTQIISFGMLSQVFRQFIAWTAFDLEHNVRVAVGLGLIGAGGLGLELDIQRKTFHYTEMMACIILILILTGSVELLSQRVRSYLREEDVETKGIIETLLSQPVKIVTSMAGRRE